MRPELEALLLAAHNAELAVLRELERTYPIGSEIVVRLRANVEHKPAIVIGHHPAGKVGTLRLRLHTGYETTLHCSRIVE